MLDPYLDAIVEAAESGAQCPPIWMTLTSGDLVVGTPRASHAVVEGTREGIVAANFSVGTLESRRKIEERRAAASAQADAAVAHFKTPVEPLEAQAITLANAIVVRADGDSAKVGVLRLNLETVAAWWLVSTQFKGKTGNLVGVGVSF